ncbi:hypothetical protein XTALMG727_2721 [Xanthomonas translucens pv. arrhenatheri LMG 727]|uniref:Uncharacterized protein n=1 Tax=Xanthomonas graminis pv. arrhenatheri LMG 727 TaxID=1195923 RepID=A0A0K2ZUJ3_9XANT|nr:hypothetical protein XTALMG727_2721 [Xanthomonas translucens pv. arrhenatheri LMG 727]
MNMTVKRITILDALGNRNRAVLKAITRRTL